MRRTGPSSVIRPDYYEPGLNSVYAAMLAHYGVVADVCRVRDPNRNSYLSIKRVLERRAALAAAPPALTQAAPEIRDIREYQDFFDTHTQHPEVSA